MSQNPVPSAGAAPAPASPSVASLRHPLTRALIALTLTTGLVDAASYLGLGRVFAANMTGNVVLLGFGIAGAGGLPVVAPLVSLMAFLAGAVAGGVLGTALKDRRRVHLLSTLAIEATLVLAAAVVAAVAVVRPGTFVGDAVIALLALGMGARNATVRKLAVPDLTTTVLTMTLAGLAADLRLFGATGTGTARRTAAVASMLIGAIIGALLLKTSLTLVLVVAGGLTASTLVGYAAVASS